MPEAHALITLSILGKPISITWWTMFGFIGNFLFMARVLVQWIVSERKKKSVVPVSFWWLSLGATVVMIIYAYGCEDVPMLLGLAVTLIPYTRNLMIHYRPDKPPRSLGLIMTAAVVISCIPAYSLWQKSDRVVDALFILGMIGTGVYYSRFPVQWVISERRRESVMTLSFWYLSLFGSIILLVYSVGRGEPPFILAFLFNSIPYTRNIILILRHRSLPPSGASQA